MISFRTDKKSDLDEKHTFDFTNSKARFIIKSPRNKTDSVIKTRLTFVESDIFWMKNIAMIKLD